MGIVFQEAKRNGFITDYPPGQYYLDNAVYSVGRYAYSANLGGMTKNEVQEVIWTLDRLALSPMKPCNEILKKSAKNPELAALLKHVWLRGEISRIVAESLPAILNLIRLVIYQNKIGFEGIHGTGPGLIVRWLRADDVGGPSLNLGALLNAGLYGTSNSTSNGWMQQDRAKYINHPLIPNQQMSEHSGLIHLGMIDLNSWRLSKDDRVQFVLNNVTTTYQPVESPFTAFSLPIAVMPYTLHAVNYNPGVSGDVNVKLLSLLVDQAQYNMF